MSLAIEEIKAVQGLMPYANMMLDDMQGEIWKFIPNFDNHYLASSLGRIKTKSRIISHNVYKDKFSSKKEKIIK